MSMRAGNDLVSSDIGSDAERIAVGKDINQDNQDVTINLGYDVDNLAVRLDFLASDMEDMRSEFAELNAKYTESISRYTEAMANDIKLSFALGILIIFMMLVFYWFGSIVLALHDDMIRLTAQVQRIQTTSQTQEAISR